MESDRIAEGNVNVNSQEDATPLETAVATSVGGKRLLRSPIGRAVCLNQGEYIQYELLAADFHRRIEEFVGRHFGQGVLLLMPLNDEQIRHLVDDLDALHKREIANLCVEFESFLNSAFENAVRQNFQLLREYFLSARGDSSIAPRICIKANHISEEDGTDYIVDVFRDDQSVPRSKFPLSANSGFQKIRANGVFFLCNDTTAVNKNTGELEYRNSRIDVQRVIKYKKPQKNSFPDLEWAQCWKDFSPSNPSHEESLVALRSFYKATLVVPITVTNHYFRDDFRRLLHIEKMERAIFGYLCFDHVLENYFQPEDIEVGYIFADLMSLYFVTRFEHVTLSKPYQLVRQILAYMTINHGRNP